MLRSVLVKIFEIAGASIDHVPPGENSDSIVGFTNCLCNEADIERSVRPSSNIFFCQIGCFAMGFCSHPSHVRV